MTQGYVGLHRRSGGGPPPLDCPVPGSGFSAYRSEAQSHVVIAYERHEKTPESASIPMHRSILNNVDLVALPRV